MVNRKQAVILILVMAVIGVVIYLGTFAGSGNTITTEGCNQIGGQLSTVTNQCTKSGVIFDVIKTIK